MHQTILLSLLVMGFIICNINLSFAQIDTLPPRPITVNGQTACEKDSECNGSCGLDPSCYWVCENNLCGYLTRPTWEPLSNREVGIPDPPAGR